jgi:predicted nucleotidyltransferase
MQIIKPIRQVDMLTVEVASEIDKVSKAIGLELLLVGAQAKVILLENIHGLDPGRATRDIDFAFAVENWDQYNQLKKNLVATGKFRESLKEKQRLLFKSSLVQYEFIVDLIPFDGVQDTENKIAWPPEMDIVMSVSGYREAIKSALLVEFSAGLVISVVSLAGLAILKIFAWSERGTTNANKDAIDLLTLLNTHHQAGNEEKIYEVLPPDIIESLNYNPDHMGAWLLGYDVPAIADSSTIQSITKLLEDKKESLVLQMAKSVADEQNALDVATALLNSFVKGIQCRSEI